MNERPAASIAELDDGGLVRALMTLSMGELREAGLASVFERRFEQRRHRRWWRWVAFGRRSSEGDRG